MPPEPPKSDPAGLRRLMGAGLGVDEVELGYVSGVFGVTGEVRLFLHNPESDLLERGREIVLIREPDGARFAASVKARSGAGKRVIGRIDGVADRDLAEAMKDWRIAVRKSDLPKPEKGSYYLHEIEGARVFVGDREVGRLAWVYPTPAGDVLEIETRDGSEFVPGRPEWVLEVDVAERRIRLAPDAWET